MVWARYLVVAIALGLPVAAHACPLCKEAIAAPAPGEEDEINNLPAAYNQSIYLMISVPYALLGGVGFLIYRGCRKNAEFRQMLEQAAERDSAD